MGDIILGGGSASIVDFGSSTIQTDNIQIFTSGSLEVRFANAEIVPQGPLILFGLVDTTQSWPKVIVNQATATVTLSARATRVDKLDINNGNLLDLNGLDLIVDNDFRLINGNGSSTANFGGSTITVSGDARFEALTSSAPMNLDYASWFINVAGV